ncbi:MAG: PIN domain-containing protein [Bacteroidota bacterium]
MDRVYVDTNIIIDWLGQRKNWYLPAKELFKRGEAGSILLFTSTVSITTTEYILAKRIGRRKTLQALIGIRQLINIVDSGEKEIDLSLASKFTDFEDAFQYYNALKADCHLIVTRNLKDFGPARIPVMTADTYIRSNR